MKLIVGIIIGGVIVSGITAYATYNYYASQVSYTNKDGTEVSVETALNELYNKNDLLWVNSNSSVEFANKKLNIDLSKYSAIIILWNQNTNGYATGYSYIEVGKNGRLRIYAYDGDYYVERSINVLSDGIEIGVGLNSVPDSGINNVRAIPTYIFGVK